jgi:hypothetical protein
MELNIICHLSATIPINFLFWQERFPIRRCQSPAIGYNNNNKKSGPDEALEALQAWLIHRLKAASYPLFVVYSGLLTLNQTVKSAGCSHSQVSYDYHGVMSPYL